MYGVRALHLQNLAIKILSLICNLSKCECNWSIFENRMDSERIGWDSEDVVDELIFDDNVLILRDVASAIRADEPLKFIT
ncbi:hypothetical protein CR513_08394, partial [Mucuna pruriens]